MVHKNKVTSIRLPVSTIEKLIKCKKWEAEPHYLVIERLIQNDK